MTWSKKTKQKVLKVSEGVLESAVDIVIFLTLYGIDTFIYTADTKRGPFYREASSIMPLFEQINYKTIKNAINNARGKGWIKHAGVGKRVNPKITEAGKRRLEAKLPFYDHKRVWDGVLHLVIYDIPEKKKNDREIFREQLRTIGCGMLQKSVWITPYNPRDTLAKFIKERKLKAEVIISSLGKDGSIGEQSVEGLVSEVYKLAELNERYRKYLDKYEDIDRPPMKALFAYLSILKDDPQLPFDLLSNDWLGHNAYSVYKAYIEKIKKEKSSDKS